MKKFLILFVKFVVMLGLLAAAASIWVLLIFINSGSLFGPGPSKAETFFITVPIIVIYFILCVIVIRFDLKKLHNLNLDKITYEKIKKE